MSPGGQFVVSPDTLPHIDPDRLGIQLSVAVEQHPHDGLHSSAFPMLRERTDRIAHAPEPLSG